MALSHDYKSIFSSKTFWGALITIAGFFWTQLADVNTQGMYVDNIMMVVGFIITVWGRFSAKKQVTLTGAPPKSNDIPPSTLRG